MTLVYPKVKKENPYDPIWKRFIALYEEKYEITPEVNYGITGNLIKGRLKNHSIKGLIRIIELFFEEEENITYDLKTILSAYYINKYAPKLKLDPNLYENAEEWNKDVY